MRALIGCVKTVCAAALLAAGCGGDNRASPGAKPHVRSDSAGIEIVLNAALAAAAPVVWTVDATPAVDIGTRDGAEEYLLAAVAGTIRLRDGRILIAESDARLRYYDSTGKHDTTVSRSGHGPGEVPRIARLLQYRSDSLLIIGAASGSGGRAVGGMLQSAKAVILDSDGRFGRQSQLRLSNPWARSILLLNALGIEGVTPAGGMIVRRAGQHPIEGARGTRWRPDIYAEMSSDGSTLDTIVVRSSVDLEETPETLPLQQYTTPFFYRRTVPVAVRAQSMYWGNGDHFEIHVFDLSRASGDTLQPSRIIRYDLPNRAADDAVRARYLALLLSGDSTAADSSERREEHKSALSRATLPAFQTLMTDSDGNLWVEHFHVASFAVVPDDGAEQRVWTVFDSAGALIGDVVTPTGLKIAQIGPDWILGIWADDDDVQHVRMHRIRKAR